MNLLESVWGWEGVCESRPVAGGRPDDSDTRTSVGDGMVAMAVAFPAAVTTWSLFQETLSGKNRWLKKSLGELKSMCIEVSPDGDILLPINTRVTKGRNEVASSIRQKIMDACSSAS